MPLYRLLRIARLLLGLVLTRAAAWLAQAEQDDVALPSPLVTLTPAAEQMVRDGQQRRHRRVKAETVVLEGSAQYRVQEAQRKRDGRI